MRGEKLKTESHFVVKGSRKDFWGDGETVV